MLFKHIEHLESYAMSAACDDIAKHGTAGLAKPIPYPLYLKCILRYAEENDINRSNPNGESFKKESVVLWMLKLDHVILRGARELHFIIASLMQCSDYDVDGVIACIHRFASRCAACEEVELMMEMMSHALKQCPIKAIRRVLIHYGASFDVNDVDFMMYACRCCCCTACFGPWHEIA